ncbi:hypothetical protein vseg_016102 [Gypsophila vaccaria]
MGALLSSVTNVIVNCRYKNRASSTSTTLSQQKRRRADRKSTELISYLPLYKAALRGQWKEARTFMDENPEAFTTKITIASETALHIAVGTGKDIPPFVEKMIWKMSPEELALC